MVTGTQLTAFTAIHWFSRSQRNSRSAASLCRAARASRRKSLRRRLCPNPGLQANHSASS